MGLDMYLTKSKFIWSDERKSTECKILSDRHANGCEISRIEFEVGYWRKANAIHRWFVSNVQNGVDDCSRYDVSRDQLRELLRLCSLTLDDHSLADKLLPSQEGFFFGNTDYSKWYFEDIQNTKEILEKILSTPDDKDFGDYYYSASW
jgi:hypothetical protein